MYESGWTGWLEVWPPLAVPLGLGVTACPGGTEGSQSGAVRAACPLQATGCHRPRWKVRKAPSEWTALPQVGVADVSPS